MTLILKRWYFENRHIQPTHTYIITGKLGSSKITVQERNTRLNKTFPTKHDIDTMNFNISNNFKSTYAPRTDRVLNVHRFLSIFVYAKV